jgi:hypothetical protein
VLVGVGVFVRVGVEVRLPVGVDVLDGRGEFVLLGVAVRLPVGVNVLDGEGVFDLVGVKVFVSVKVLLGSGVLVCVNVLEGSGVLLGVGVGVLVGIQAEVRISKAKTSIFFMGSTSVFQSRQMQRECNAADTGHSNTILGKGKMGYWESPGYRRRYGIFYGGGGQVEVCRYCWHSAWVRERVRRERARLINSCTSR